MILLCSISCSDVNGGDGDDSFIQSSDGEEKQERKLKRIDTDISTQI
jgi:hypothetical protein